MTLQKGLHIGMSLAPTWLSGEGWRRPDSRVESLFGSDFALDIARRSEAAHLDFVFRPDVSCVVADALQSGSGFTSLDPTVLLAALTRETTRIGLVSTVSTTFYPPYLVARQLQSLNWLSNGRVGWNIVTALQGHENFGLAAMPSAEERYARAAEFTDVVQRLWRSFPNQALLIDRDNGVYADPAQVQPIARRHRLRPHPGPGRRRRAAPRPHSAGRTPWPQRCRYPPAAGAEFVPGAHAKTGARTVHGHPCAGRQGA
jgi:alkanesulfonate monooxygenase SsuD/methylene tetrahydromethanopterin reductase-like flavin-dependent oxidoreductase (luciferase family)